MSLLDKVSLALIPSAYKASKLYSVIPANGDGDFSFVRNSSGTRVNSNGLIESVGVNVPRLDYSDGNCPSLLLEPQRSNLITYSEDFTQWSNNGGTLTPNAAVSPSGENNAYKYNTDGAYRIFRNLVTLNTSTNYTFTFYAKNIDGANAYYRVFNNTNASDVIGVTNYISQINTSTWTRIEVNFTTDASGTEYAVYLMSGDSGGEILIWGAQLEQGSYATSYIPTNGSIATRIVETCTDAGNASTFNDSEGVLFAEISALNSTASSSQYISISDGTYNNRASILFSNGATNQIRTFLRVGGVSQIDVNDIVSDVTDFNKIAFSYKENNFKVYINGSLASSDTSGSVWSTNTITKLSFSEINTSTNPFYGNTKQLEYFNTALTDLELETLTSWTSFNEMAQSLNYTTY